MRPSHDQTGHVASSLVDGTRNIRDGTVRFPEEHARPDLPVDGPAGPDGDGLHIRFKGAAGFRIDDMVIAFASDDQLPLVDPRSDDRVEDRPTAGILLRLL